MNEDVKARLRAKAAAMRAETEAKSEPAAESVTIQTCEPVKQEAAEPLPHPIRPSIIAAHIPTPYKKVENEPVVQPGHGLDNKKDDAEKDADINKALNFALASIFVGISALLFSFWNPMGMSGIFVLLTLTVAGLVFASIAKYYGLTKGFVFVTFSCNMLGFLIVCCLLLMQLQDDPISNLVQMMG